MHRGKTGPDPVSCQSCRTKKLRCNRVYPCSNCTSRGISCILPARAGAHRRQNTAETPASVTTESSNEDLSKRIERLEAIVLQSDSNHVASYTPGYADRTLQDVQPQQRLALTPVSLETAPPTTFRQDINSDLEYLENVGTREGPLAPYSSFSHDLVFTVKSVEDILATQVVVHSEGSHVSPNLPSNTIIFPEYKIAMALMKSYESTVDQIVRIVHLPTNRSHLKNLYLQMNRGESIPLGEAALFLSMFSVAALFYLPQETSEKGTVELNSACLSKTFSKCATDVLEISRRMTSGSIEDVQACVLMSYTTYHLEGFSTRCRFFSTTAIAIAKDLRLHQLDARGHFCTQETALREAIGLEVKRRLFWHIVSTDWMMAAISGPQEGTYFIHPNHINVNLPQNVNDDDLTFGVIPTSIAEQEPTSMSYFLERVRLAQICREIADTVPLETSKLLQLPYEQIVSLDQKLEQFMSALPFFYKLDAQSRERTKPLEDIYPDIISQRHCITRAVLCRRCKLHQRFLLRQSLDHRYAYSRRACLDSARAVLRRFDDFVDHESPQTLNNARIGLITHFRHLALTVMVIDLCFNSSPDQPEIKSFVKSALQKFEDSRNVSPIFGRFLKSLCDTLRKHHVDLNDLPSLATNQVADFVNENNSGVSDVGSNGQNQMQAESFGMDYFDPDISIDTIFDDSWNVPFEITPGVDLSTWDNLFSVLDSRPL